MYVGLCAYYLVILHACDVASARIQCYNYTKCIYYSEGKGMDYGTIAKIHACATAIAHASILDIVNVYAHDRGGLRDEEIPAAVKVGLGSRSLARPSLRSFVRWPKRPSAVRLPLRPYVWSARPRSTVRVC